LFRALSVLVASAYLLLGVTAWQLVLVEIVDSHEASEEPCPDDEDGDCDCGPNCHCCIACAHHGTPVPPRPADPAVAAYAIEATILLGAPPDPASQLVRGPPIKVPRPFV
jgi:hypothetical protein